MPEGAAALAELRSAIRAGAEGGADRARELLGRLTDPLDLEAAGSLLRGDSARARLATAGFVETRIALLGSSTLDPLPALVTAAGVRRRLVPQVALAGYNQWQLEILAGAPQLSGLRPRITACLLDDAAVFAGVRDPVDVGEVADRCAAVPAELAEWVSSARSALGGLTVLSTIPLSPLRRHSVISFAGRSRLEAAWLRMNAAIADLAASQPATVVLAASDLSEVAGATFADDRMRHVAAHAYAPQFLWAFAEELARLAAADLGRAGKCLVLDLDETLWSGTVGEDGLAGLRLGGGYPGSAHAELQTLARDLSRQGVLLAVCSKNDEKVAAEAVANHPDMLLRPESFAATRINWQPKPDNLQAIAAELNIGPDALVFVDDSPLERDLMRRFAPQVVTVELPADPAGYARRLAGRGDFAVLTLTAEDRDRAERYRAEALRRRLVHTAGSLEEYLAGLGSRLVVEPLTPLNADRIVQLFAKTNQFNLSGIRYGAEEIDRRSAAGDAVFFGARLTDRLGDNGLIAAVAIGYRPDGVWEVENMVLSCRVFGRGVEDAVLGLILRRAAQRRVPAVTAVFRATAKNARFADFYPRLGFQEADPPDPGRYRHTLADLPDIPQWIELAENLEVLGVR